MPESNDQGNWHGVKVEAAGFIEDKDVYDEGKAFHASIAEGTARANYADHEGDDAAPSDKF